MSISSTNETYLERKAHRDQRSSHETHCRPSNSSSNRSTGIRAVSSISGRSAR